MTRSRRLWLAAIVVVLLGVRADAAIFFLEAGTAATQDLTFWGTVTVGGGGSVATDTGTTRNNARALKIVGASAAFSTSFSSKTAGRLSAFFQASSVSLQTPILGQMAGVNGCSGLVANTSGFLSAGIDSAGHLQVLAVGAAGAQITKTGAGTVATAAAWHRLSLVSNITSVSNWTATATLFSADGTTQLDTVTASNADANLLSAAYSNICVASVASQTINISDVYADDSNALTDPGNINVTPKRPAANSTNNFDTAIGTCANRWDCVNERPLSETKGWQQAGSTQVAEAYTTDTASGGDTDISTATIAGYNGWLWARTDNIATTPTTTAVNASTNGAQATASGSCALKATGTTCTTGAFSVAANDLCIAAFADLVGSTAPSITSSPTSTWTALSGPTTSTVRLSWWFSVMSSGNASTTATFTTISSAAARAGAVSCFAAASTAATPKDVNPVNTTDATSTYNGPASGTLAQANEWIVGVYAWAGVSTSTTATTGSWLDLTGTAIGTTGGSAATNVKLYMQYQSVTATTTQTPGATNSVNAAGAQGTVSFKRTGATAGTPQLTLNGADNSVTLGQGASSLLNVFTTSATFPTGAFGMKSTGTAADTYFYEGGVQVAYVPGGAPPATVPNRLQLLGVREIWARLAKP